MQVDKLRQSYPEFVYWGFTTAQDEKTFKIIYHFEITHLANFYPFLVVPILSPVKLADIHQSIFWLGMVEALSYWKTTCSPNFIIKTGSLSTTAVKFFENLLLKGMGEFFYSNRIDFTQPDFVKFITYTKVDNFDDSVLQNKNLSKALKGDLILVGGGKDSAVMLDLLKNLDTEKTVMYVNPSPAAEAITKEAGITKIIKVFRQIDAQLLLLNKQGFLNGHTPFSALLAFLGALVAQIYGLENIIVGNEADAEEENVIYLGQKINHQYSKTWDFENKFRLLLKAANTPQNYFSLLRPLNELQIAYLFSQLPQYFDLFVSCNRNHGLSWCGECAKCLNSYLLLLPFLSKKDIRKIFQSDYLNKKNSQILSQILGLRGHKPFECVGALATTQAAFSLMIQKHYLDINLPPHLSQIEQIISQIMPLPKAKKILQTLGKHWVGLPDKYLQIIKAQYEQISNS